MKIREMKRFYEHMDHYFEQTDSTVLHPIVDDGFHVDVLLYKPSEKYPFWKLITMGASDFKMPRLQNSLGNRNEYMIFVDPELDLTDREVLTWYYNILLSIAYYPAATNTAVTYAHSIEWGEAEEGCDMEGAFLEFPQMIETTDILRCKLGLMKTVVCLQAITLTRSEIDKLMEIGPQEFSSFLYPDDDSKPHFLCEKKRTDRF